MRNRRWGAFAVLAALSVLALLSGCSEIIPGLNLSAGGEGQHQYRIVAGEQSGQYSVQQEHKLPQYQVVPITANLVASLAAQPAPAIEQLTGGPLKPLLPSEVPPEYRIGPGDIVNVTVWDHPELTAPSGTIQQSTTFNGQLVASDGTMYYPFVGTFKAAGMTARDLREYLTDHLQRYIQNPQVDVRVVSFQADRVEITGEVQKPGTITLDNTPKGVLQAIDAAGGLTAAASRRRAILVRHGVRYEIDLAGLLSGNRLVPNPALQPGDVIHIPDQSYDQVFVLGAVSKQQPLTLTQDSMTLMQALTDSGGLDNTRANGSGVLVFRLARPRAETQPQTLQAAPAPTEATVFTLDLSTPQGVLLASQFQLHPRDVVYVKATKFAQYNSVINQLLPTITAVFETRQLTR